MPDSEIDFSDIPELTAEQLSQMKPIKWYKHRNRRKR